MSSIQKELEQLEKWLGGSLPRPEPSPSTDSLLTAVERLSKQFEVQQHALNHIVDRLDILEGMRNEPCYMDLHDDPWLDHSPTQLQNEIIDPIEPVYHICKTETLFEPVLSPVTEQHVVLPHVIEQNVVLPHVIEQPVADKPVAEQPVAEQPVAEQPVAEQPVAEQPVEEEQEQDEQEEEEEQEEQQEEQEEEEQKEQQEEEQEEEEQQEEEEDEGVELLEYKGMSYYKDSEGFIYSIEEDEQPSEIAIGYWKEKTNSIAFYKK